MCEDTTNQVRNYGRTLQCLNIENFKLEIQGSKLINHIQFNHSNESNRELAKRAECK